MQSSNLKRGYLGILIAIVWSIICGCANSRHAVIAVTGTNIGLEVSQNPANQSPQAKLGYQRSEIAIVPSNRSGKEEPGDKGSGAADVANVLMELNFANIFSLRSLTGPSLYQRLAVGETAVKQSVLMFARDDRGEISGDAANAIESIKTINPEIEAGKRKITDFYRTAKPEIQTDIVLAVTEAGYKDWNAFIDGIPNEPSLTTIENIKKNLRAKGITIP